jgi:hypothetical protein
MKVGTYWLVRIGVVMVLTGLGVFRKPRVPKLHQQTWAGWQGVPALSDEARSCSEADGGGNEKPLRKRSAIMPQVLFAGA